MIILVSPLLILLKLFWSYVEMMQGHPLMHSHITNATVCARVLCILYKTVRLFSFTALKYGGPVRSVKRSHIYACSTYNLASRSRECVTHGGFHVLRAPATARPGSVRLLQA